MEREKLDEILQQGMYGPKEIKPEERKRFLGTLRERIVIALTQAQVREKGIYPEIEKAIKENPKAHLFLNGQMEYEAVSKYSKIASKFNMPFTMVNNQGVETDIGLVLAYNYAVDKEDIFIKKAIKINTAQKTVKNVSFFNKLKKKLF
jgi:uncharacterized protein YueI